MNRFCYYRCDQTFDEEIVKIHSDITSYSIRKLGVDIK